MSFWKHSVDHLAQISLYWKYWSSKNTVIFWIQSSSSRISFQTSVLSMFLSPSFAVTITLPKRPETKLKRVDICYLVKSLKLCSEFSSSSTLITKHFIHQLYTINFIIYQQKKQLKFESKKIKQITLMFWSKSFFSKCLPVHHQIF